MLASCLAVGHPAPFTVAHIIVLHTSGARATISDPFIVLYTSGARATIDRVRHLVDIQRDPSRR